MSFTFAPAVREQVSLLIALAGASGSGKTKSALRLAEGISPAGKIAFVDTEARRGLHYADQHRFLHADMRPPFKPIRFVEAIAAAKAAGAEVVILDSFSHEYDGEGGIIDWADALAESGTKAPGNWKEPKLAHKRMMNALLQCRATLIFCLRADEKIEIVREGGRTQVRPLGWMPICEKRFMYEMTASFTLSPDSPGIPRFDLPHKVQEQHRGFFPERKAIDEACGQQLAAWARGGAQAPRRTKADLLADARAQAARGSFALAEWLAGLPERARVILEEIRDELATVAEAADAHADENDGFPGFTAASEQAA
ncbi:ATP-binding protein [Methylobacterium sp. NMS14P]|uniref:AAA family ATPase n=1 Tax=Methylobacterium sp. NMS14P TaxID=2894310 RepID=UPI0023599F74|nr:AAA family ATPase [Methylobacterium sp. NMS14P]WCS27827.1 ATP-binding protein [Methylobacterium sp. NMS14P]